jgi:Leucine-rich repeat (LRR) protein
MQRRTEFPNEITNWGNLQYLDISGNNITRLPEHLLSYKNLISIRLDKNLSRDPVILQLLIEGKVRVTYW